MPSYLVREEDGTSKLTLEEGGGSILLEESVSGVVNQTSLTLMGVGMTTMESNNG